MNIFICGLLVLLVVCGLLYLFTRAALPTVTDANFIHLQRSYLIVYLLAMAGDWLQGPHVYALYDSYGMTTHDIEVLFVAGFGSSLVFGTIVGSFADRYGRRTNCLLYGILYSLACITKHFNNFWVLMVGRLLGGMATSILYSAFESWLIYEHNKRGFEPELLSNIFSHAVLGNSIVAILAGLVAQKFADLFGFVAPFDVSMATLIVMGILVVLTWTENYGNKTSSFQHTFSQAFTSIRTDHKILCLGLIQSLFEGSMYVFVLEWTPALEPAELKVSPKDALSPTSSQTTDGHRGLIPHGYIFAAFMVAVMIGSSLFKLLTKKMAVENYMRFVLLVSMMALLSPVLFPGNQLAIFSGFLVFEICVGIFWPALSTMRGKYVPEETRATTMNLFRIPLNFIVVSILLQNLPMKIIFEFCAFFLFLAAVVQHWLFRMYQNLPKTQPLPAKAASLGLQEDFKQQNSQQLLETEEMA